jgi:hypothetical protein
MIDSFAPIVSYHGDEVKVLRKYSSTMIEIFPADPKTKRAWSRGHKRDSALNRWVKQDELQPADCTCDERSGIACKACRDWHAVTGDGDMPF